MKRGWGILLHVSSLPNDYGIGGFGEECFAFIDFLAGAGARYWQVLPLVPTGFGNSPYQSPAAGMLNPYFISLPELAKRSLLTEGELSSAKRDWKYIDYGALYRERFPLLKKAFSRFCGGTAFARWVKEGRAKDYALFMALKEAHGGASFDCWDAPYKFAEPAALGTFAKEHENELLFWQWTQFEAEREWAAVKEYAGRKRVEIVGDLPIYAAYDSLEVWKNPQLFKLDKDLRPTMVAGVPPDYFSEDGQLWGNPVFDYLAHEREGFRWWTGRVANALRRFDYVRIDHFRGLDRYYEIPAGNPTARGGHWVSVPHEKLFSAIAKKADMRRIIAEDLGILDDGVYKLLEKTGFPGMSVLSFAFDGDPHNKYLPERIGRNSVCYTGTHDNRPLMGMLAAMNEEEKSAFNARVRESMRKMKVRKKTDSDGALAGAVTELGFACRADAFILPMQDAALLGDEYRMNEPSTDKAQNWSVRFERRRFRPALSCRLSALAEKYKRKAKT